MNITSIATSQQPQFAVPEHMTHPVHFNFLGDVYNIAWSGSNRWLLAGTAAGLVGWNIEDNKVKEQGKDYKYVYFFYF